MSKSQLLGRIAAIALIAAWTPACTQMSMLTQGNSPNAAKAKTAKPGAQTADGSPMKSLAENLDAELQSAKDARNRGDLAGAIQTLSQLMLVAPDDPRVVASYGKVLVAEGRSSDAVQFLKRAAELNPNDWSVYSALGVAYDQQNDYTNAKGAYARALQLKPGEAVVLNNYAMSRMLAGDIVTANQLIAQAQATGNADPKIAHNLALMTSLKGETKPPVPPPAGMAIKQTPSGPALVQALPKHPHTAAATPANAASTSTTASAPPHALVAKAKPAPVKAADPTPSLRTAAD